MATRAYNKGERYVFSTDVPSEIGRKVCEIAAAERRSISQTVRNLLEDALDAREQREAHA